MTTSSIKSKTRRFFIAVGILATILFNCLLVYLLLWDSYWFYFNRPEFSTVHFETRDTLSLVATFMNLGLLLVLTILMVVRYVRSKRFLFWSPLFSLITFFLLRLLSTYHPDGYTEYTKDGYRYLNQSWYLEGNKRHQHFRSAEPDSTYTNHREIVWELQSSSE